MSGTWDTIHQKQSEQIDVLQAKLCKAEGQVAAFVACCKTMSCSQPELTNHYEFPAYLPCDKCEECRALALVADTAAIATRHNTEIAAKELEKWATILTNKGHHGAGFILQEATADERNKLYDIGKG